MIARLPAAVVSVLMLGLPAAAADAPPKRPNVIVVLCDDQGYGDFSCHGNPVLKTPNLDRMHGQSIRLLDFHVTPMCTPTRGQLMTGMDALRNGAASVSAGRTFIRRGIPTMAEMFAAAGYRTALYGKWHLGDMYPFRPENRGFEDTVYHLGWGITSLPDVWENDLFDGRFRHNGKLQQYKGYSTDVFFNLTMARAKECKDRGEPFFIYLPTNAVHGPTWVADKYKAPYRSLGKVASFFGMMANVDENMGRLDDFLKKEGLYDDTVVVYFNDNGGTAGVPVYNAGMRGHKTEYYEGGHRAACFIRWPNGKLRPAGDVPGLTQVQDLLPTLLDFCGIASPKNAKFDGINLANVLRDPAGKVPERTLVVQYGEQPGGRPLEKGHCAVMWNRWRLVENKELYDLDTDPGQKTDVAAAHPDIVARLRGHYEKWWAEIAPRLEDFEPITVGAGPEETVTLSAADWAKAYCDNASDLRSGKKANGPWHLLVEKDGEYEIELRRWPREADAAITAGVPEFKAVDGGLKAGVALPVASVRIKIGDHEDKREVSPTDKGVTFIVQLKAGKTTLRGSLLDAAGKELSGAYFAYVTRK